MLANHKPVKILINGNLTAIGQGMYHTSILALSGRWSTNRKAVNSFLKLLEEDSMITTARSRKDGTTINICNYALYQDFFSCDGTKEGQRKSPYNEKYGEKYATKTGINGTTEKADVHAVKQGFSTPAGQPAGRPEEQLTGQPEGQPAGHKQELKNDNNDQEKREINPCPSKMGGYAQVALHDEDGGAAQAAIHSEDGCGAPTGKNQNGNDMPFQSTYGCDPRRQGAQRLSVLYRAHPDLKRPDMPKQMQDAFDAFWASYPKKASKGDARKAWKQIQPDSELLTKMLTSLERAKTCAGWIKDGGQYIPYPATWLRAEGWEDEIVPAHRAAPQPQRRET